MISYFREIFSTLSVVTLAVIAFSSQAGEIGSNFDNRHLGENACLNSSNPINVVTGNKYQNFKVFEDSGEFPLEFSWHYNSRVLDYEKSDINNKSYYRGLWTHSYGQFGYILPTSDKRGILNIVREDGSYRPYLLPREIYADNFEDIPGLNPGDYSYTDTFVFRQESSSKQGQTPDISDGNNLVQVEYQMNCSTDPRDRGCKFIGYRSAVVYRESDGVKEYYSFEEILPSDPLFSDGSILVPRFTTGGSGAGSTDINPLVGGGTGVYRAVLRKLESPTGQTQTLSWGTNSLTITHSNGRQLRLSAGGIYDLKDSPRRNSYFTQLEVVGAGLSWSFDFIGGNTEANQYKMLQAVRTNGYLSRPAGALGFYGYYNGAYNVDPNWKSATALIDFSRTSDSQNTHIAGWAYNNKGRAYRSYRGPELSAKVASGNYPSEYMTLADEFIGYDSDAPFEHHNLRGYTNILGKKITYDFVRDGYVSPLKTIEGDASTNCPKAGHAFTYYKIDEFSKDGLTGQRKTQKGAKGFIAHFKNYVYDDNGRKKGLPRSITYARKQDQSGNWITSGDEYTVAYDWQVGTTSDTNQPYRMIKQVKTPDLQTDYTYYANNRIKTVKQTDIKIHASPLPSYLTYGLTRTWEYSYTYHDTQQQRLATESLDGPLPGTGDSFVKSYNSSGQLTSVGRPSNLVTQYFDHNAWGLPTRILNENGSESRLRYWQGAHGPLLESIEHRESAGSESVQRFTFTYHPVLEKIERVTYPNGSWIQVYYKAGQAGGVSEDIDYIVNNFGERIDYSITRDRGTQLQTAVVNYLNSGGQVVYSSEAIADALGRLYQQTQGTIAGSSRWQEFNYDLNNNNDFFKQHGLDSSGAPKELETFFTFNGRNQIATESAPDAGVTAYEYDDGASLNSVTDAELRETQYIYNGFGEVIEKRSRDSGTTVYRYDEAGNLKNEYRGYNEANSSSLHGVTYLYDNNNRLTGITYDGYAGKSEVYVYDTTHSIFNGSVLASDTSSRGRLSFASNEHTNTYFRYDKVGNLTGKGEYVKATGKHYVTLYTYNASSLYDLEGMTYPSGMQLVYGLDALGRINTIRYRKSATSNLESLVSAVEYYPFGPVRTLTFANGTTQTFTLDDAYNIDRIDVSHNLLSLNYSFNDGFGNISSITRTSLNKSSSDSFTYDDAHRLATATGDYGVHEYRYNDIGDRDMHYVDGAWFFYDYKMDGKWLHIPHWDAKITGQDKYYFFDEIGNATESHANTFSHDVTNRLTQAISRANGQVTNYAHDNFGQRVWKLNTSGRKLFHYGLSGELLAESLGDWGRNYVFLDGRLIAQIDHSGAWIASGGESQAGGNNVTVSAGTDTASGYQLNRTVNGDLDLNANLSSLQGTPVGVSAGLQLANNSALSGDYLRISRHAIQKIILLHGDILTPIVLPQENVVNVRYRQNGVETSENYTTNDSFLRIQRVGSTAYVYSSSDGQSWTQRGSSLALNINSEAQLGLFVAGKLKADLTFGNIALAGQTIDMFTPYYVYTNHLMTPVVIADKNRSVVWEGVYSPFGSVNVLVAAIENNVRFPGQYFDSETGLYYNYFRDYDPAIGRYIQSDPIGLNGGINTYAYAAGNPVNAIDPYGLDCIAINGSVTCNVPGGGPTITFPRPAGWPDTMNSNSSNYHYYNIPVPLDGADPKCVMQGIANNPTPGLPSPATPNGTLNNATPSGAQAFFNGIDYVSSFGNDPGGYNNSPVNSYLLNDGSVVVNVTLPGHPLHPGYVARDVSNGQVNNRGEGTGFLQGPYSPVSGMINGVWNGQTGGVVDSCGCP